MCGIVGMFGSGVQDSSSLELIRRLTDSLSHRGPDGQGIYIDDIVALGHRRLSIIDLSIHGQQPLANEDGTLQLVFNGEIYNYRALRTKLIAKGHRFRSGSDAEVVLHLYEEKSVDCLRELEGMFAFALYDKTRRILFLARDRTGEKPLYYMWFQRILFFTSEIKAFWNIPLYQSEISEEAVFSYFTYTQVPAPNSIYQNVRKLLPACYLRVDIDGNTEIRPYWKIDFTVKTRKNFTQAMSELEDVLTESINNSAVSDVPIGIPLSGGIDSSIIVGILKKSGHENLMTFTLGRDAKATQDPEFARARKIADLYQTNHFEFQFNNTPFSAFEEAISSFDEPCRSSFIG